MMKSFHKIIFLSLSFILAGCMPDSFTKFKEDPPHKQTSDSSGGSTTTVVPSEGPENLSYPQTSYTLAVGSPITNIVVENVENSPSLYSITPALPTGLSFNTTTGTISGTPTVYSSETNYIISASNSAGSTTVNLALTVLNEPSGLRYEATPIVRLTVGSAANFSIGGNISSQLGGSGTVDSISGNQISIQVNSGIFSSTTTLNGIDNTSTYIGNETTVDEIDFSIKQKLKVSSTTSFPMGTTVSNSLGDYGVVLEVVNSTEIIIGVYVGSFNSLDTLDDTSPFVATVDTITEISFLFLPDEDIDIRPILGVGENISYSVSPELPSNFSNFLEDFGWIQGNQNNSELLLVNATATNTVGSTTISFFIGSEESPPKNMNFSQDFILTLSQTSAFAEGEEITTSDSNDSALGTVIRVIDTNNLHIRMKHGVFGPGKGVDNVSPYGGEKAIIISADPVSTVLYVNDGTATNFARKGFISSTGDAGQGLVAMVDDNGAGEDIIYVYTYKGSFVVGDSSSLSIDNAENFSAAETSVNRLEAGHLRLKLTNMASFSAKGSEITTTDGATGIVNDYDAFNQYVYVAVDYPGFTYQNTGNDDVDNYNPYSAAETDITEMAADRSFYLYRDEKVRINAFLRKGSSPTWSITPDLPTGLSLDTQTGHITGTATESSAKKTYTVKAFNTIDGVEYEESYSFFLQVFDHFTVSNVTENTTSYILHKEGRKNGSAKCRITADQVAGSIQSNKDIICRLEGEEKDIFQEGIELEINSSAGLCQFMVHTPYNYYARSIAPTTTHTVYHRNQLAEGSPTCIVPESDPTTNGTTNRCLSDYSLTTASSGRKNCDTGSYTVRTIVWSGVADVPCATSATENEEVVSCGGNHGKCSEGPIRDIGIDADNFVGVSVNSSFGIKEKYTYTSPLSATDQGSNRRLVNYVANNDCTDSGAGTAQGYRYQADNWANYRFTSYSVAGTITLANTNANSTYLERRTVTPSADLTTSFQAGDMVTVDYGPFGTANHRISSITAGEIIFQQPLNTAISDLSLGPYNISPHYYSEPFKGPRVRPYYTFECQDAAQDTIARIRIQVREWDRKFSVNDDIDLLSTLHTGDVDSTSGSSTLSGATGVATLFSTELPSNPVNTIYPMLKFEDQVNQPSSIASATSLTMIDNATTTHNNVSFYSRPILSDSGTATDLFSQEYNDHNDWDDYNENSNRPILKSCGAGVPSRDSARREQYYDFQGSFYKN